MTKTKLEKLKGRIGDTIKTFSLLLDEEDDGSPNLIVVYLELQHGNPYVFGCAGDGSILVNITKPDALVSASGVVEPFSNSVLVGVSATNNQLILSTSRGTIALRNDGDELFLSIPAPWDA